MSYLEDKGWKPCTDSSHSHPEAGQGTLLHPPSGDESVWTPRELISYDDAVYRGLTGFLPGQSQEDDDENP